MQCKTHPNRKAEHFCASCGIPICNECTEEVTPGQYYCFQCAMFQTVSGVGTTLKDKRSKVAGKKRNEKKKWGPFHYFVISSSVLIAVMWGVIIFGGQKAPGGAVDFTKNKRVFLFMVDGAIKRYAHFEGGKYPEKLFDITPKHLSLRKKDIHHLEMLSYKRDPDFGYRLSFATSKPGQMSIIISPKGIEYKLPSSEVPK